MFKKLTPLAFAALALMGTAHGADNAKIPMEKFYGKIAAVNVQGQTLTAFNKGKKMEASFQINEQTRVVLKKQAQPLSALEVGKSVIVYYVKGSEKPLAQRITIRAQAQKKT